MPIRRQVGMLRAGERLSIQLAIAVKRQGIQLNQMARHHIFRQQGQHILTDRAAVQLPVRDEVAAKVRCSLLVLVSGQRSFAHLGVARQYMLDLGQLDPIAANFDLIIHPSIELEIALLIDHAQIPGAIQHGIVRVWMQVCVWIRDEYPACSLLIAIITIAHAGTRYADLPFDA
ncbi:hypothetical protein PA598K_02983 [Paenibacillus sp. 598K]|nr:hypothetical protein PA598K_02983 [Paenibacillus sp. 598K]